MLPAALGPPGLIPSRSNAEADPVPRSRPASRRKADGSVSSVSDQGASARIGVPTAARKRSPYAVMSRRRSASTPRPSTAASGQTIGVNAVVTVRSRAYAQVARQLPRGASGSVPSRNPWAATAARAISGSRTRRTAVPIRPVARAPVAAGRKAYATLAQARSSREGSSGREAK